MFKNIKKEQKILFVAGICTLLLLVVGSTYAYFVVNSRNNATQTSAAGNLVRPGDLTLTTNTSKLYLSLSANNMAEENKGTIYYANSDASGTPILNPTLGNGIYNLATVNLNSSDIKYDCNYKYKLTGTITKEITGGSDEDIKVKISGDSIPNGSVEYTLKQIVDAGSNGIDITGTFKKVTTGQAQTITIESSVANTEELQDELSGSSYTINIEPYAGTEGFSCKILPKPIGLAKVVIETGDLWQSGLEGDGYRYVGSGVDKCSSSDGTYVWGVNQDGSCTTLYNVIQKRISDGMTWKYNYRESCPANNSTYTYECQTLISEKIIKNDNPNNYICFGTSDKNECVTNPNNYMYRIIGVFPDDEGNQNVKIIKYSNMYSTTWNDTNTNVDWNGSTLYKNINSTAFLNNTTYVPNSEWKNKIVNWKWTAANTKTTENNGPYYYDGLSPSNIYLHEMNRNGKTNIIGEWTYPVAKIGLMNVNDYVLSLGNLAKNMTSGTYSNMVVLKMGWMHISNNVDEANDSYDWTITRYGDAYQGLDYEAYYISERGNVSGNASVDSTCAFRPTFYLDNKIELIGGSGTLTDPYIIKE